MFCYSLGAVRVTGSHRLKGSAQYLCGVGLRTNPALEVVADLDQCLHYIERLELRETSWVMRLMAS